MGAIAKIHMMVRRTSDIELFGMGKIRFIAIACPCPAHHILTRFDLVSIEHRIMASRAPQEIRGKVTAQYLINSPWYQRWISTQLLIDLWMLATTMDGSAKHYCG